MLDIKFIRENPDKVRENMKRKFQEKNLHLVDDLLKLDKEYIVLLKEVEALRMERNSLS
jgi:seryl-tRNA synthetase